ncbi:Macrolide export ATP-binding/permease protein macB [Fibrisoma limi BUZ 3]|uniref:Macrolide export ATP-binding/permease protein macB n=1 Tax=Fibrisoma limi BUZ 3 TaxID=1185876 RepID=I2GDE2_9BACT|nr:ABC transporter permease [Fibrisoma limi]CCH51916.1 Macrolide export ATP-binding/permease protein macB [Fibrisoma limi BUZ 3]
MLRNYVKIAVRNLLRSKSFSAINILGLSVGMTCCMLLLLYIRSELSFDKHHEHADNLYLMGQQMTIGGKALNGIGEKTSSASAPFAFALKSDYPEIEQVGRLWVNIIDDKALLQVRESGKVLQSFYETKGYQIDSTFFDLFTYQFTEGNHRTALLDPNSVVLSETVAQKLFGKNPALNKIIRINGTMGRGQDYKVTGVYKDESNRSHIDARFFIPMSAGWTGRFLREARLDFASNNMFVTYLRLRPDSDPHRLEQKFPAFIEKHARNDLKMVGFDKKLFLVAVPDLHLYSGFESVITPTNSVTYLYILGSIALFTLLIACINFMNLSTARSAKRAAEVGVRKVMGAEQGALVRQFLGESMILTLMALLIAIVMVAVFLPLFNQLTGKSLSVFELFQPQIALAFLALALATGLIAGSYPAFYLSLFNPAQVLKGKFINSMSAITLRRALVIFQFVVSVGLVLATFIIQEQMRYLRDKPLGFTQDQQIAIPFRSTESRAAYTAFRNEILRNNQVVSAAGTQYYPGIANATDFILHLPEQTASQGHDVKTNWVDYDYLQTMGFRLKQGRLFSREFPGDTNRRIVVNEATLRKFQIPEQKAIGQKLDFEWQGETQQFEIVGVVGDFHFQDLHQTIEPYAFLLNNDPDFNYIIVHVNTADMASVLSFLEQKWKAIRPDEPFAFTFLNEDFQHNYQAEARTSRIVSTFTIISILISCLGLFGLAAFAAQQRTKEIGVRKVLGASVTNIVMLLATDFMKLVLIAIVIASPVAWWAMSKWLDNFAYKIAIPWWVFVVSGALAITIAFVTISFQSIKAALMNPVKSLRAE